MRRYEFQGKLGKAKPIAGGGVRIPASIARVGIQEYLKDGKVVREYRPPEEVFSEETLRSLTDAPVTIGHIVRSVDPSNWKTVSVGHVSGNALKSEDGNWTHADLTVNQRDALNKIDKEDLIEVSAGYDLDIDETPGVTPTGEQYDRIQRNIRYNHVALLEAGKARAGSGARLRLDSNDEQLIEEKEDDTMADSVKKEPARKVRVDGIEYDFGSESHVSALNKRIDSADSEITSLKTANSEIKAERDGLAKENAELKEANSEDRLDSLVNAELAFRDELRPVLGKDYDFSGKSRNDVRLDAITKLEPDTKLDEADAKDESYVRAYLAHARKVAKPFDHNQHVKTSVHTDSKALAFHDYVAEQTKKLYNEGNIS